MLSPILYSHPYWLVALLKLPDQLITKRARVSERSRPVICHTCCIASGDARLGPLEVLALARLLLLVCVALGTAERGIHLPLARSRHLCARRAPTRKLALKDHTVAHSHEEERLLHAVHRIVVVVWLGSLDLVRWCVHHNHLWRITCLHE